MQISHTHHIPGLLLSEGEPLIGVFVEDHGVKKVRYFSEEQEADRTIPKASVNLALRLAGAWKDLASWEETKAALDKIRHESQPTPPIDQL